MLFWKYCLGRENSLSSATNLVSSATNSVSSLSHTNNRLRGTHRALSPELGEGNKNSLSSVFETVLSQTVFGPFPTFWAPPRFHSTTLLALQITFVNFSFEPAWEFCIEKWWGFLVNFPGLRLPRNEAQKLLKKFGENSEQNSGQNSGWKFPNFGKLSFCNFSDLTFQEIPLIFPGYLPAKDQGSVDGGFQPVVRAYWEMEFPCLASI